MFTPISKLLRKHDSTTYKPKQKNLQLKLRCLQDLLTYVSNIRRQRKHRINPKNPLQSKCL